MLISGQATGLIFSCRHDHNLRLKCFRNFVPDHDSEMVVRLKQAGLVIFGKTHAPEFGLSTSSESRLFGATHNPWNLEYSVGGSSGGSAAAIASGMVPMAYGNDGGGSIRIPASCCGLFGLKPTRARTPVGPDVGEWWSGMAIAHAITRSVRDSAACSTRPLVRKSEIHIGRRRRSVLIKRRSGPNLGGSESLLPPKRGTFTRSIRNASTRWMRPRSYARTLVTT